MCTAEKKLAKKILLYSVVFCWYLTSSAETINLKLSEQQDDTILVVSSAISYTISLAPPNTCNQFIDPDTNGINASSMTFTFPSCRTGKWSCKYGVDKQINFHIVSEKKPSPSELQGTAKYIMPVTYYTLHWTPVSSSLLLGYNIYINNCYCGFSSSTTFKTDNFSPEFEKCMKNGMLDATFTTTAVYKSPLSESVQSNKVVLGQAMGIHVTNAQAMRHYVSFQKNSSTNMITIRSKGFVEVKIVTLHGRVLETISGQETIMLSYDSIPAGVYLIQIISAGRKFVRSITL